MKQRRICVVLLCLFFYCQETLQARVQNCRRTNKKPFRYCLDRVCTSNRDCRSNEQCLCDGDCGLSCVRNGTDCGKPEISKAVRVRYSSGTKFQSVASFQCKGKQYTLRGSKKQICRGIGKWDGRSAKCRILCKHPGEIVSGNNNGDKKFYRVGNTVSYWCFPGYDMEGAKVIECNKRGKWNKPPPQCTTPSCPKPTPPDNAYILSRRKLKEKYQFNQVVAFRCEHGYYTSGSAFRRCLANGWSNSNFRCIPKSCGDPGTPTNGKRIGYVFTFKKKVYFTCNRGFLRVGPEYRQCQSNQKWSDKTPTCEPIDCGRLPEPQHGEKIEETSTTFGGKVVFVCKKEGFELKGSARRVCGENGRWSGNRTTCERVECPDPGTLIKGVRIPDKSKYVFEDRIDFQCDTNYTLRGDPFIICRKTKDWTGSGSVPQCLAPCRDPGIPIGGSRLQHSFLHNSVVQFRCNPGWTREGSHTIQCNNGQWDRDPPTCNKMCPRPNRFPANGGIYRSPPYVLHGSSIRFYCRGGYNLVGQQYVGCRNGTWNSRQPRCKPVECRDPGTPRYGVRRPEKNKYVFDDRIDFQCRTNYTLRGDRSITCQKDKSWSRSVPRCLAPCRDPGIPIGGSRLQHSFLHNRLVRFRCNPGWTMEGSYIIRCNSGRWDRDPPTCNKICAKPNKYPDNGGIHGTSGYYRHNEYITFYCRGGYQLVGQDYVRCRNGTWNSRQPTCKPVECRDPGTPRDGVRRQDKNKYVFEDRIDFQCRTNYTLRGDRSITCQKDKSWSGSVPRCLAPCTDPGTPNNGQRVGNSFLHGYEVKFSCIQGWNIEGSQTIRCDNGNWNQPTPECKEGCSTPRNPINGGINPLKDFYKHKDKVRYLCNHGYRGFGNEYITCEHGQWNYKPPTCKRICGNPGRPDNGYFRESREPEFFEGREIRFYCYGGFDLIGSRTARCLPTGQWSERRPECKRGCRNPLARNTNSIPHPFLHQGQKIIHGTNITFTCRQNHTLEGPSIIYCLNGRWTGQVPVCKASCPYPWDIKSGKKIGEKYEHGQKVYYACLESYTLVGSSYMSCDNGQWVLDRVNQRPSCKKSCPDPGQVIRGSKAVSDYRHGGKVIYTCDEGTRMIGEPSLICHDGNWSSVRPTCLGICPDPGNIANGYKIEKKNLFLSGDNATFRCNSGFDLFGRAEISCSDNGEWDFEFPICFGRCRVPSNFTGVQSRPVIKPRSALRHKSRIRFYCIKGTQLVGSKETVCEDGSWRNQFPICKVPCSDPGPISNGLQRSTNFTAKYKCNENYSLIGAGIIKCIRGRWTRRPPKCLKNCKDPGQPINGTKNSTEFRHGKSISFECLKGFRLEGSISITCNDGTWNSNIPYCKGVCPALGAPANGDILDPNFDYKARVRFRCNQGYTMDGPPILICFNGKWSSDQPTCKAPCSSPGFLRSGRRKGDNFVHGGSVEFFCDHGYDLFGAQTITCKDGNWSSPVPTCETGCSYLEIPEGMKTQGNVGKSRSTVSFSCTRPLVLTGKSVLTCIDGSWSDRLPTCSECGSALGMETRNIPDGNIQASSTRDPYRHTAKEGRLNGPRAWCSGRETQPYLEIDFGKPYRITGLATQGSAYDNRWVRWYSLKSNLAGSTFVTYRENGNVKLFEGNKDTNTQVRQKLRNPFISRRLQIYPTKQGGYRTYPACMRVEIYGCDLPLDCVMVRSRVVAKWISLHSGMYIYLKAYLTNIGKRYWRVELENENHGSPWNKDFPKYANIPFVLDVPPKHEELQVGTRVLVPWGYRYFTGTIRRTRVHRYNRYQVRADDGDEKHLTIDQIRLLKAPRFCE